MDTAAAPCNADCKATLNQRAKFTFVLSIQLLPDQASLLNRIKAQICNPLKNLQSAYKSVLVSYVQNESSVFHTVVVIEGTVNKETNIANRTINYSES